MGGDILDEISDENGINENAEMGQMNGKINKY
jgi:hypothetical protein